MQKKSDRKWERVPMPKGVVVEMNHAKVSVRDITSEGMFVVTKRGAFIAGEAVNVMIVEHGKPLINLVAIVKRSEADGYGVKISCKETPQYHLDRYLLFVKKCKRQL